MKKNLFPALVFILVLITILSSSSDFSFAEEHSLEIHENETEKISVSEHTEEENLSHEREESHGTEEETEEFHPHGSVIAEVAQWVGLGTMSVAVPAFAVKIRSANKLAYKNTVLTLAVGVGIVHLLLAPDHLLDTGMAHGIYFAVVGSGQIGFGLLFMAKPTRRLAIAGTVATVGSVILYFVTRIANLPEPFGAVEEFDSVGIIAKIAEISLVALLVYLALYIKTKSQEIEKTT